MTLNQLGKIRSAFQAPDPIDGTDIKERFLSSHEDEETIVFDGLDMAIIGTVERCGAQEVLCYSRARIRRILMLRDKMTLDEAEEFIDRNIAGLYAGTGTPMLLS